MTNDEIDWAALETDISAEPTREARGPDAKREGFPCQACRGTGRFQGVRLKRLGVTQSGMRVLFRGKRGDTVTGGNAGHKLAQDGLLSGYDLTRCVWIDQPKLTPAGLAICEQARRLGY